MVFPARAGMIQILPRPMLAHYSIPRESGDDPVVVHKGIPDTQYSPRERG